DATPHRLDAWLTSVQASAPPSEVEKDAGYRGVRPASSPLHAPWGAALPWNQRQLWPGIGGSFGLESAAALLWNQWQHSCGTGGSFAVELVAGFTWNRWQLWRGIRRHGRCRHRTCHYRNAPKPPTLRPIIRSAQRQ